MSFKKGTPIQNSASQNLLPGVSAVINWADAAERANFSVFASIKEELGESEGNLDSTEKEVKARSSVSLEVGQLWGKSAWWY